MAFTLTDLLGAARDLYDEDRDTPEYHRALIDLVVQLAELPRDAGSEIVRAALTAR